MRVYFLYLSCISKSGNKFCITFPLSLQTFLLFLELENFLSPCYWKNTGFRYTLESRVRIRDSPIMEQVKPSLPLTSYSISFLGKPFSLLLQEVLQEKERRERPPLSFSLLFPSPRLPPCVVYPFFLSFSPSNKEKQAAVSVALRITDRKRVRDRRKREKEREIEERKEGRKGEKGEKERIQRESEGTRNEQRE